MKINKQMDIIEKVVIIIVLLFSLFFILGLVIVQWPNWWKWIIFERTPMTWLESTLLYTSALLSFICALITVFSNKKISLYWFVIGFGFFYLCFDERFAIHERIRDSILIPKGISIPFFPWIGSGDFILVLLLVAGLITFYKVKIVFYKRRSSFIIFITGIVIAAGAILLDSWDVHHYSIEFQRLEQFFEEILETISMLCFLSAIWLQLTFNINQNINK